MNLRKRKKEKINQLILSKAKQLFEQKGYDETSMSEIAAGCDIAVGTLYNYYDSKPEIFVAAVGTYMSDEIDRSFDDLIEPIDDVADLVMAFTLKYLEPYLKLDLDMLWGLTKAVLNLGLTSPIVKHLVKVDQFTLNKLIKALEKKKRAGQLPADFNSELHAENAYSIVGTEMMMTIFVPERERASMYERIEKKIRLYFNTSLKGIS